MSEYEVVKDSRDGQILSIWEDMMQIDDDVEHDTTRGEGLVFSDVSVPSP